MAILPRRLPRVLRRRHPEESVGFEEERGRGPSLQSDLVDSLRDCLQLMLSKYENLDIIFKIKCTWIEVFIGSKVQCLFIVDQAGK